MNRPRLIAAKPRRETFSGPVGTVLSVLLGAVALVVVGPILGRGFEPGSGPADLVTVPGSTGARSAPEGVISALAEALRALGVRPVEPDAVQIGQTDFAQLETADVAADIVMPGLALEFTLAADPSPLPGTEVFALVTMPDAAAPVVEDVAADENSQDGDGAVGSAIVVASEPPPTPRPQPVPTRAPILPTGLNLSVVSTLTVPTPRPPAAPAAPAATRQPGPVSTPNPTAVRTRR